MIISDGIMGLIEEEPLETQIQRRNWRRIGYILGKPTRLRKEGAQMEASGIVEIWVPKGDIEMYTKWRDDEMQD